ncbi:MAG: STAS domain-containing protein [Clostridiales bacterium]|nr:STAS domain-containing protein [Clostridiales bacterium]
MKITTEYRHGRLTVWLNGELDHHVAKDIIETVCREIDQCLPLSCFIDMKGVGFMDSSGIAVILKIYKRMKELGGTVIIRNLGKHARKVLDISGINRLVNMEEVKA